MRTEIQCKVLLDPITSTETQGLFKLLGTESSGRRPPRLSHRAPWDRDLTAEEAVMGKRWGRLKLVT